MGQFRRDIPCMLCGRPIRAIYEELEEGGVIQEEYIHGFGHVPIIERISVDGYDLGNFNERILADVKLLAETYNCHCGCHFLCSSCQDRPDWKHWLRFCIEGKWEEPFYPLAIPT